MLQTYKNIEIILVDDGSTDKSGNICDEYAKKDNRIKVIHKENDGQGPARNTGIEDASGEWFCFIDSDDFINNKFVESLLTAAVKNNCIMSTCKPFYGYLDTQPDCVSNKMPVILNWRDTVIWRYVNIPGLFPQVPATLYHKSIFENIRFKKVIYEDLEIFPRIFDVVKNYKTALIDEYLYYQFCRSNSITRPNYNKEVELSNYTGEVYRVELFESIVKKYTAENEPVLAEIFQKELFAILMLSYFNLSAFCTNMNCEYFYNKITENLKRELLNYNSQLNIPLLAEENLKKLQENKVVLYGLGRNCCSNIKSIKLFIPDILEIWDSKSTDSEIFFDIAVKKPHSELDKNALIVFTLENEFIQKTVETQLLSMGYKNFMSMQVFLKTLEFAKIKKYMPKLLEEI
jgi:glycosyltransferase involved in cell wall biosynthesis